MLHPELRAGVIHLTEQTPYQPGTMSRTGAPWLRVRGSPFMRKASNVSGCRALASGSPRAKRIGFRMIGFRARVCSFTHHFERVAQRLGAFEHQR